MLIPIFVEVMDWPQTLFAVWSPAASWLMKDYCWVFGGQSTYGTVNSESKNKLLCKNPKCANTTGSKFNQLSLVAEMQLPFDCTNKWNPFSPFPGRSRSLQTSLKGLLHPGDDTLSAMTATLICHVALSDTNSIEQLWSEISEVVTQREREEGKRGLRRGTESSLHNNL